MVSLAKRQKARSASFGGRRKDVAKMTMRRKNSPNVKKARDTAIRNAKRRLRICKSLNDFGGPSPKRGSVGCFSSFSGSKLMNGQFELNLKKIQLESEITQLNRSRRQI